MPDRAPSPYETAKPSFVRAALERLNHLPSKVLGQNFLIDANIVKIIERAAALGSNDGVLEIGPGLGVLTEQLIRRALR